MQCKQKVILVQYLRWAIVLAGILIRVRQFVFNRSFALDESFLALNIINRGFLDLTRPLDYSQGAPIGFLWVQKALISIFGNTDFILRIMPFAASVAALLLMAVLTTLTQPTKSTQSPRQMLGEAGGILALTLFALSDQLTAYATDMKQYASDTLITLALLVFARRCLQNNTGTRDWAGFCTVVILSVWISHPSVFVLAGIFTFLIFDKCLHKNLQALRVLCAITFLLTMSFAAVYALSLRALALNSVLVNYWQAGFMPMPPWSRWDWFLNSLPIVLANPMSLSPWPLGVGLITLGCGALLFRRWTLALGLAVSGLAAFVASGLQKYPLSDRLLLFAVPAVYWLVGEGLRGLNLLLSRISHGLARVTTGLVVVVMLYSPIQRSIDTFLHPIQWEEIKPVMAFVEQHKSNDDAIYVYYAAVPAFTYYAPFYGIAENDFVEGISSRKDPQQYLKDLDRLRNHKQVWFVFSHICSLCIVHEEIYFLKYLDQVGKRMDQIQTVNASAYRYQLND